MAGPTRVYLSSPHFQTLGLGFYLSLLQTNHKSSSVLCITESVRKVIEARLPGKGYIGNLNRYHRLLSMGTVKIDTPTSNTWMCLSSHSHFYKMCVKLTVLYSRLSLSTSYCIINSRCKGRNSQTRLHFGNLCINKYLNRVINAIKVYMYIIII